MGFRRFAEKLKAKKEKFDNDKQELEKSSLMGSLRSGRIDVFDEVRSKLQGWYRGLGRERDNLRQMKEMFDALDKAVDRVVKNKDEYAPKEDPATTKKFYETLKDLLNEAIKGKNATDNLDGNWEDSKYDTMNAAISRTNELKEKAKQVAAKRSKSGVPTGTGKNGWAKVLAHGIEKVKNAKEEIDEATSEIRKLTSGKNKALEFQKAMQTLENEVQKKELRAFKMKMLWAERDTENNMDFASRATESEGEIRNDGENNIRKHEKKLKDVQGEYAKCTNKAIDTLIDIRDFVDSDDKTKVITPREENIYKSLQKITKRDLIKETQRELEAAVKAGGRQRSNAVIGDHRSRS